MQRTGGDLHDAGRDGRDNSEFLAEDLSGGLREDYERIPKDYLKRQARIGAELTRPEMDYQKMLYPGMTDEEAWAETRRIFCLVEIPDPNPPQPEPISEEERAARLKAIAKREEENPMSFTNWLKRGETVTETQRARFQVELGKLYEEEIMRRG